MRTRLPTISAGRRRLIIRMPAPDATRLQPGHRSASHTNTESRTTTGSLTVHAGNTARSGRLGRWNSR